MIALLSLPDAEETEKFIAEKAAEQKNVAEMIITVLALFDLRKGLDENFSARVFFCSAETSETNLNYATSRNPCSFVYRNVPNTSSF